MQRGEAVLDGALARVKEGNEVKSWEAARAGRRECRGEILGDAEDGGADVHRGDAVGIDEGADEFLRRLPNLFFVVAFCGRSAAYAAHLQTPLWTSR